MSLYAKRMEKIRKVMKQKEIDALVVTKPVNIYYFTKYYPPGDSAFLIPLEGEPAFFVYHLFLERAKEMSHYKNLRPHRYYSLKPEGGIEGPTNVVESIEAMVREKNLQETTVGIEFNHLSISSFQKLKTCLPEVKFRNVSNIIQRLRMVKDSHEINALSEVLRLTENAFRTVIDAIAPGLTEKKIAWMIEDALLSIGIETVTGIQVNSGPDSVDVTANIWPRSSAPELRGGKRRTEKRDHLLADVHTKLSHYHSDIARTIFVGPPKPKVKKIFDIMLLALHNAIKALKPGQRACDIDLLARKIIWKAGYGEFFPHFTGHGIGLESHEPPNLCSSDKTIIRPGMVFCLEPGIYVPGVGGVRVEDTVVVTDDGCEPLNTIPEELSAMT